MPPRAYTQMFAHCTTPLQCFKHLLTIPSAHVNDQVVRGCVLQMYHQQSLTLSDLKEMLWSEPVACANPSGHTLESAERLWCENVGPFEDTLHWRNHTLVKDLERMMGTFTVEELRLCFAIQDAACNAMCHHMSQICIGVMDFFFTTSCFAFPVVLTMGPLFWMFAKAFIVLEVSDSDMLNFLLWDKVLAQTVLALEPTFYAIDSLMDPISVPLTIKGRRGPQGAHTIVAIASHANLWFMCSVRLSTLSLEHYTTDAPSSAQFLVRMIGTRGLRLTAELTNVDVMGAGIEATNFWTVTCTNVNFEDASCALHVTSAFSLDVKGEQSDDPLAVTPCFNRCELAISTRDVAHVVLTDQYFEWPLQAFEIRYTADCVMRNCVVEFRDEGQLGSVLGQPSPVLENFRVIQVQKSTKKYMARFVSYTISDLSCADSLAPLIARRHEKA